MCVRRNTDKHVPTRVTCLTFDFIAKQLSVRETTDGLIDRQKDVCTQETDD